MLCAAMGIERDDEGGISRLAEFRMSVYVLKDTGQRLSDFHTVGVGYDKTGEKGFISRKIEKKNPNTVLTRREYLIDCKFSVLLSGNQELVEQCASALVNPRWGVWLGRKSCIPAARICEGTFDTVDLAKKRLEEITATPNRQRIIKGVALFDEETGSINRQRVIKDAALFDEGTDSIQDIPLNYAKRQFKLRRISDADL